MDLECNTWRGWRHLRPGQGCFPPAAFYAASGLFLFLVYDYWCQGMPWYLADSNRMGDYQGHVDYFQLLCWASVLLLLWVAWSRMRPAGTRSRFAALRIPAPVGWGAAGLLAVGSLAYAATCQIQDQKDGAAVRAGERASLPGTNSQSYVTLAVWLYREQRSHEALAAARRAVAVDPSNVVALRTLGIIYYDFGMLDEAVQVLGEAVRLEPDSLPAKANLERVQEEKQRRSHRH